ncbi:MAG: hypothetical protein IIB76_06175 [Proteobacteria bacterium]|nr:hypothetical protein [Pseudomonadota bacterium]
MSLGSIIIKRRFIGPPNSANGGYACGRIAAFIDGSAEVTLRRPPPIDQEMTVREESDGSVAMYDGETLIGSGESISFASVPINAPTFDQASKAAQRTFDASLHTLPTCFVCGPQRDPGDGLRIHVGPIDPQDKQWHGVLAAPWVAGENLADDEGIVLPEFVWAALDCPTAYACSSPAGMRHILLGRQTVEILRRPSVAERCIIAAQEISHDGRKSYAAATLFGEEGDAIAFCKATWIEVEPHVHKGALK